MPSTEQIPGTSNTPSRRTRDRSSIYKVPRRFDLVTVMIVTFAYAAFFGSMRAMGVPTGVQAAIIGLLSVVGIIQMIVPARYVRFAAIACGCLAFVGIDVFMNMQDQTRPRMSSSMLCVTIVFGPLLGYCSGVVVAGVFLVTDYARRGVKRLMKKRVD